MESPLAGDRLVEAQEDSTSAESRLRATTTNSDTSTRSRQKPDAATSPDDPDDFRSRLCDSPAPEATIAARLQPPADSFRPGDDGTVAEEDEGGPREPIAPSSAWIVALATDFQSAEDARTSQTGEHAASRKRPATDFLPISAEIKRMGVEVSVERAEQLKNDIRRLSPVVVSLRERTLGEISLTPDSSQKSEGDAELPENGREELRPSVLVLDDSSCTSTSIAGSGSDAREDDAVVVGVAAAAAVGEFASASSDDVPSSSADEVAEDSNESAIDERIRRRDGSDCRREAVVGDDLDSRLASGSVVADDEGCRSASIQSKVDNTRERSASPPPPPVECRSNVCRDSVVVLTRDDALEKWQEGGCTERYAGAGGVDSRTAGATSECADTRDAVAVTSPETRSQRRVRMVLEEGAATAVIGNLEEQQEIVFASSTGIPSPDVGGGDDDDDDDATFAKSIATALDSPESTPCGSPDDVPEEEAIQESADTETETETGSDSSEVTSLTIVQLPSCDEGAVVDADHCANTDPLACDEISPEIMTRLEPERPEAFTEDSAESLAMASGSRDEVRSDGSDSGLGSEIPGDPGPAPAPESDSETSFLDRIPDDILSDKEKAVSQLETTFEASVTVSDAPQTPLPTFRSPPKSNLKRRLTDCMEGETDRKRSNIEEPRKKKRSIQFDAVTVYYFPRAQGFTCVPSQGGSTLGMSATHTHAERFSLSEHAAEQRRLHRARLAQLRTERAANCVTEAASSSEDPSDDTDEEPSDNEELDIDSYYFLQPVPTWQRRALLRAAGVRRIDAVEKDDCRDIRASREHCGCGCKGYCDPESCPCSRANVKCQVDRAGFPCGCSRDGCANSSGRIEFNPVRVRTHFIHTLMRLELEKKHREEEIEYDAENQPGRGSLRDVGLNSVMETDSCINGGGFTTLHYENPQLQDAGGGGGACQSEVTVAREDSLDLYAIRDDCYPSGDVVDGVQSQQRKLHPEFGQTFQGFPGHASPGVAFQQSAYPEYQSYQALPSTSRAQFQPQFQPISPNGPAYAHYASYDQEAAGSIQASCQSHVAHASAGYETPFPQDEGGAASQYTNLNSVQPMNAVVQQMGKLEPFSELLAGRYSYYGDVEPPSHGNYHPSPAKAIDPEKSGQQTIERQGENAEECDENFGEIIKKSMVETVSA